MSPPTISYTTSWDLTQTDNSQPVVADGQVGNGSEVDVLGHGDRAVSASTDDEIVSHSGTAVRTGRV